MVTERGLNDDQRRLLRLIGLMPLASAAELALFLDQPLDRTRRRVSISRRWTWATNTSARS